MRNPKRITIAIDDETEEFIKELKDEKEVSQSEIIRRAIRFYHKNRALAEAEVGKKLSGYLDMLLSGEHIILDVDHWILFLKLLESSANKETFWNECKQIARSHAEQLSEKIHTIDDLMERLEICNFFRTTRNAPNDFTLILGSESAKEFVKVFLKEFLSVMGYTAKITENLAKMRVRT